MDLSARITLPAEGQLVNEGEHITVRFVIKNQGPDSILMGDSLNYKLSHLFRVIEERNVPFTQVLSPGDSVDFQDTLHISGGYSGDRIALGFHRVPIAFSYNQNLPLTPEFYEDQGDNRSSVYVRYRLLSTEELSREKEFHMYPNPCFSKRLRLDLSDQKAVSIKVVSITGEQVHARQSVLNGDIIDLQMLQSGLYILQVFEREGVVTSQKLLIP